MVCHILDCPHAVNMKDFRINGGRMNSRRYYMSDADRGYVRRLSFASDLCDRTELLVVLRLEGHQTVVFH
jgi:hypothetical protein